MAEISENTGFWIWYFEAMKKIEHEIQSFLPPMKDWEEMQTLTFDVPSIPSFAFCWMWVVPETMFASFSPVEILKEGAMRNQNEDFLVEIL